MKQLSVALGLICLALSPSARAAAPSCTTAALDALMAEGVVAKALDTCQKLEPALRTHDLTARIDGSLGPLLALCTKPPSLNALCARAGGQGGPSAQLGQFAALAARIASDYTYLLRTCKTTPPNAQKKPDDKVTAKQRLTRACPNGAAGRTPLPAADAFAAARAEDIAQRAGSDKRLTTLVNLGGLPPLPPPPPPAPAASSAGQAPAATGGSLIGIIVGGLAEFLVTRARAELQQYVLEELHTALCGNDAKARVWIPRLCQFLGDQSTDLDLGASFGVAFKSAAMDDLMRLPLVALAELEGRKDLTDAVLRGRLVLRVVRTLLDTRSLGRLSIALGKLAAGWQCSDASEASCTAFKRAVGQGALILRALTDIQRKSAVTEADVQRVLLYVAAALGRPLTAQQTLEVRELVDAAFAVAQLGKRLSTGKEDVGATVRTAIQVATELLTMVASALSLTGHDVTIPPDAAGLLQAIGRQDFGQILVRGVALVRELASDIKIPAGVQKVLTLGVELASAKNTQDAAEAFDAFSAPVGAWRIKNKRYGASLNGFVGVTGGAEWLVGGPRLTAGGVSGSASLTGAVGVDFFVPDGCGHWSFFLSVVDLGGFLNIRTDTDTTTAADGTGATQDAKVSATASEEALQLLSPGLFISHSLGKDLPLNVGIGASYVPYGRIVTVADTPTTVADVRAFAFIAVDITIFPFD